MPILYDALPHNLFMCLLIYIILSRMLATNVSRGAYNLSELDDLWACFADLRELLVHKLRSSLKTGSVVSQYLLQECPI